MVKVAASVNMLGYEVQCSVPAEEAVKESPLGEANVTRPVKELTHEPAPVGPAPLPVYSPRCHRYPARLTVQKLPEELKVQVKCPRRTPAKVIGDRADTGTTVEREKMASSITGIKNRASDFLDLKLSLSRYCLP